MTNGGIEADDDADEPFGGVSGSAIVEYEEHLTVDGKVIRTPVSSGPTKAPWDKAKRRTGYNADDFEREYEPTWPEDNRDPTASHPLLRQMSEFLRTDGKDHRWAKDLVDQAAAEITDLILKAQNSGYYEIDRLKKEIYRLGKLAEEVTQSLNESDVKVVEQAKSLAHARDRLKAVLAEKPVSLETLLEHDRSGHLRWALEEALKYEPSIDQQAHIEKALAAVAPIKIETKPADLASGALF